MMENVLNLIVQLLLIAKIIVTIAMK